jgi:hypothetical protein
MNPRHLLCKFRGSRIEDSVECRPEDTIGNDGGRCACYMVDDGLVWEHMADGSY